jgi:nucleotide-binding universal stress UspA family protein
MTMYDSIIVPLDGTLHAELALPTAVDEARRYHATLVLVHVVPGPELTTSPTACSHSLTPPAHCQDTDFHASTELGRRYLDLVKQRWGLPSGAVVMVLVGEPVSHILSATRHLARPLIVTATDDTSDVACPPLGAVARQILRTSTFPVFGVYPGSLERTPVGSGSTDA